MNLVDLLLQLSIPVWLVLPLALVASLAVIFYKHLLERRISQLEHRLQQKATSDEMFLAFLQERHRKRLDALHEVNGELMRFDHGVEHVRAGNSGRGATLLQHGYEQARELSRKYEDLLGKRFYQVVLDYTNYGASILRSRFVVTNETIAKLEQSGIDSSKWNGLQHLIGQRIPISEAGPRLRDVDVRPSPPPLRSVTNFLDIVGDFDEEAYQQAKDRYESLKQEVLHTLPSLPSEDVAWDPSRTKAGHSDPGGSLHEIG